jgi:predicted transcriptional regulator
MSYSIDFRKKENLSVVKTAKLFGIAPSTVQEWSKRIKPKKCTYLSKKIDIDKLKEDVEKYPDAYQKERAERLGITENMVYYLLKKLKANGVTLFKIINKAQK